MRFLALIPFFTSLALAQPGTPTSFQCAGWSGKGSDIQLNLTWVRADDTDTSITVSRSTTSGGTYTPTALAAHTDLLNDTNTLPATAYYYKVHATNGSGSSADAGPINCTSGADATNGFSDASSFSVTNTDAWTNTIQWTDSNTGFRIWQVQYSTDGVWYSTVNPILGAIEPGGTGVQTYVDGGGYSGTTLTPGTLYYYRIWVMNGNGEYSHWTYGSATTAAQPGGYPNAPTGFSCTPTSGTSASCSWTDTNSGGASTLVETSTYNNDVPSFSQVASVSAGTNTYTLTTTAEQFYWIRIRASNGSGNSGYAPIIKMRTPSPTVGGGGNTYTVCPSGCTYTTIGASPIATGMGPGDTINISCTGGSSPCTYNEKFVMTNRGTTASHITVNCTSDVRIDGTNAVQTFASTYINSLGNDDLWLTSMGRRTGAVFAWSPGYIDLIGCQIQNAVNGAAYYSGAIVKGSGNSGIYFTNNTNSTTTAIVAVAAGNNTPLTVTYSAPTVTINLATNSGGAAASTVNQVVTAVNAVGGIPVTAVASGAGSGTLAAFSSTTFARTYLLPSGMYIFEGDHITFQSNTIHGNSGNGIFSAGSGESRNVNDISTGVCPNGNYLYGNGNASPNPTLYHNTYQEGINMLYECNLMGDLATGSQGTIGVKDRSAGAIIRYNKMVNTVTSGSAGFITIGEFQNDAQLTSVNPLANSVQIYGNDIEDLTATLTSSSPTLFGGWGYPGSWLGTGRSGPYLVYDNDITLQSNRGSVYHWSLFGTQVSNATVDLRNNIIWNGATSGNTTGHIYLIDYQLGRVGYFGKDNWISSGYYNCNEFQTCLGILNSPSGAIVNNGATNNPGFTTSPTNVSFNLSLTSGGQAVGIGGVLGGNWATVTNQYVDPNSGTARANIADLGAYLYSSTPTANPPAFSPVAGTYTGTQSVTLSTTTGGAAICYNTTGTPTAATPGTCDAGSTTYTTPVSVAASETLYAIATESGYINSSIASAAYVINTPTVANPTFSPAAGSYVGAQTVTISTVTSAATICYKLDGTSPAATVPGTCDAGSLTYSGTISVTSTKTITALGTKSGDLNSGIASATYTITPSPGSVVIGGRIINGTIN